MRECYRLTCGCVRGLVNGERAVVGKAWLGQSGAFWSVTDANAAVPPPPNLLPMARRNPLSADEHGSAIATQHAMIPQHSTLNARSKPPVAE